MKDKDKIIKIFEDIDLAIKQSISDKPCSIYESNFIKKYFSIKKKYLED